MVINVRLALGAALAGAIALLAWPRFAYADAEWSPPVEKYVLANGTP